MRKFLLLIILFCPIALLADVRVSISEGIDNGSVKAKMERTMSALLTEINSAQAEGRAINFAPLGISSKVQTSMSMLWENSPFICLDEVITERCLMTSTGYQVRNIPLEMKPIEDFQFSNDEEYQEAVISFDKSGNVLSFYLTLSNKLYVKVLRSNLELTDHRRRQLVLDYVEQFRTAYNTKDIKFLEQVFSDDALIITGTEIKQKTSDAIALPSKIQYKQQSKQEYLENLKTKVFSRNSYIHVSFDDIKVVRHPQRRDFYGVTLHQGWRTSTYSDDGYVFLLWDFTDEQAPQIHVRTWQPSSFEDGTKISEEEIFSLADFDI